MSDSPKPSSTPAPTGPALKLPVHNGPVLNWKELEILVRSVREEMQELQGFHGYHVERVIVPERPHFPGGYLKGEWILRLTGRKRECCLLFSIRPRHPYFAFIPGKGPKASTQATHSPFEMAFSKQLKGTRLLSVEALRRERTVILWFGNAGGSEKLGLVLTLIPAAPEALLVSAPTAADSAGWPILARSRVFKGPDKEEESRKSALYFPPDGSKAPDSLPIRTEWVESPERYLRQIEKSLDHEAFTLRSQAITKRFKDLLKTASDRIQQSQGALKEAEREADWQHFADALKNSLGNLPPLAEKAGPPGKNWVREVPDYHTGETIPVPCDPNLSPTEQVEKFYQYARRKKRRIEEARARLAGFTEAKARFEKLLGGLPGSPDGRPEGHLDWPALERLEKAAHLGPRSPAQAGSKNHKAEGAWLGKSFVSKEGWTIWVGRNKTENLELTFKRARGNDLWMHVRGRPGAHVLIPVQPGKSVSLETLLDAANLAIYYSGGENWGKTEVDYTFKKHVKRIKDSSEASYTHNKTLIVEPDSPRLKRLLAALEPG